MNTASIEPRAGRADTGRQTLTRLYIIQSTLVFEDQFEDHLGITRAKFLDSFTGDFASEYVAMFQRMGYEVTFLFLSRKVSQPEQETHRPTGAGVVFLPVSSLYSRLIGARTIFRTEAGRYLESTLSTMSPALFDHLKNSPGVLYVQDYHTGRFDVLSKYAVQLGLPVIGTHHGSSVPRLLHPIKRRTLRRAAFISVLNSDEERRMNESFGSIAIRRIVNPINISAFAQSGETVYRAPSEGGRLLYAGRLHERKDVPHLIRTLALLPKPYTLTLAGSGPDEAALRALAAETGVADRVEFLGFVGRQELIAQYRKADVFVLAAQWEGWALVLGEAGSIGLPAVGRDVEGVRDQIIDGVTGRLVKSPEPKAFADAIVEIMDGVRSGTAYQHTDIARTVSQMCAAESVQKTWETAFQEIGIR